MLPQPVSDDGHRAPTQLAISILVNDIWPVGMNLNFLGLNLRMSTRWCVREGGTWYSRFGAPEKKAARMTAANSVVGSPSQ